MQDGGRGIRKRPRVSNACTRCRQQKIKCSGTQPCIQCSRRKVTCAFETSTNKILVDASYIERLQRQAAPRTANAHHEAEPADLTPPNSNGNDLLSSTRSRLNDIEANTNDSTLNVRLSSLPPYQSLAREASLRSITREDTSEHDDHLRAETSPFGGSSLHNPLLPGDAPSYTIDPYGQPVFLGTSSNWSFCRRVLTMAHKRVSGNALPPANLLFENISYDLGWDGLRDSALFDTSSLPTSDYALFLINAVKFHCTRLFHVFDEDVFMRHFSMFHEQGENITQKPPVLWFVHYLLILAFGKAFIIHTGKGRSPPGVELFVRAMKLLPDITFLCKDPIQAIEIQICAALYLQCVDMRSAAHNMVGQAVRLAIEQGYHTNMVGHQGSEKVVERCRSAWWTVYILDRRMSSLMGTPVAIADSDITATLPSYSTSARKALALTHHVKLSKATSTILHTVYSKNSTDRPFLNSVKDAMKAVAEGSDERENVFPLALDSTSSGLCRLSAYLHLFHHQKRLESATPSARVTSEGGVRRLLRVCVSSAKHTMRILAALQSQSLLDSFLPFDREAGFAAGTVLVLAAAVDGSLLRQKSYWLQKAYDMLDEMSARGSIIATFHKSELLQLEVNVQDLQASLQNSRRTEQIDGPAPTTDAPQIASTAPFAGPDTTASIQTDPTDFSSEDGLLNGNQLQSIAEGFDFDDLDYWLATGNLEGPLRDL